MGAEASWAASVEIWSACAGAARGLVLWTLLSWWVVVLFGGAGGERMLEWRWVVAERSVGLYASN